MTGAPIRWRLAAALAAVAALALSALTPPLAAQNVAGTMTGTVLDEQKQVVPGATVTIINEGTGEARAATSDARGEFQVTTLPPGTYTVRIEMTGFRTVERKHNVLTAAERLSLGMFTLEIGALGETIVVASTGSRVNPAETQYTGLITARQIEQIQVKARDVTTLMRLVPGVRYEETTESLGDSFGTLVPHVGGKRRDWNPIRVDGVLGNEIGQAQGEQRGDTRPTSLEPPCDPDEERENDEEDRILIL